MHAQLCSQLTHLYGGLRFFAHITLGQTSGSFGCARYRFGTTSLCIGGVFFALRYYAGFLKRRSLVQAAVQGKNFIPDRFDLPLKRTELFFRSFNFSLQVVLFRSIHLACCGSYALAQLGLQRCRLLAHCGRSNAAFHLPEQGFVSLRSVY